MSNEAFDWFVLLTGWFVLLAVGGLVGMLVESWLEWRRERRRNLGEPEWRARTLGGWRDLREPEWRSHRIGVWRDWSRR
jgi:hypothetical protein